MMISKASPFMFHELLQGIDVDVGYNVNKGCNARTSTLIVSKAYTVVD